MSGEANKLATEIRLEYEANLRDLAKRQVRWTSQLKRLANEQKEDKENQAAIEELIDDIKRLRRKCSNMEHSIRKELQALDELSRAASEMTQENQDDLDRMLRGDGQL
jgi:hypothetical protein